MAYIWPMTPVLLIEAGSFGTTYAYLDLTTSQRTMSERDSESNAQKQVQTSLFAIGLTKSDSEAELWKCYCGELQRELDVFDIEF